MNLYHELEYHSKKVAAATNDDNNLDNFEEVRHHEYLVNAHLVGFDAISGFGIVLNQLAQVFGLLIFVRV